MRFELKTAETYYNLENKTRLEKLGFTFIKLDEDSLPCYKGYYYLKSNASIELNSIEDLVKLIESCEEKLIITRDSITIYDGYVE